MDMIGYSLKKGKLQMKNLPLILTAIVAAFSLIILGVYLYQTAPENNTPNLPDKGQDTAVVEPDNSLSSTLTSDENASEDAAADNTSADSDEQFVSVELVNVSPDGIIVLSGQSNPENKIKVHHKDDLIASAKVNKNGDWAAVPDAPLAAGTYLLTVTASSPDGDSISAQRDVVVVIPEDDDTAPLVALVPSEEAGESEAELLQSPLTENPDDSAISVTDNSVIAVDPTVPDDMVADPSLPPKVTIRIIEALSDDRMAISGFRQGSGDIAVTVDNVPATVTINPEGYLAEANIPDKNRFTVAVIMTDDNGDTLASASIVLNKAKLDETLDGNTLVVVQKGDALWRIAYRTYGQGIKYIDIFSSNANEINDPDLIYPDQIFIIPN